MGHFWCFWLFWGTKYGASEILMAKEMGLDRAPIEFKTFYFSHVLVVPPNVHGVFE